MSGTPIGMPEEEYSVNGICAPRYVPMTDGIRDHFVTGEWRDAYAKASFPTAPSVQMENAPGAFGTGRVARAVCGWSVLHTRCRLDHGTTIVAVVG